MVSTSLSRRHKHLRRYHADRRRLARVNMETDRRKAGARRVADTDYSNFAYHGA